MHIGLSPVYEWIQTLQKDNPYAYRVKDKDTIQLTGPKG